MNRLVRLFQTFPARTMSSKSKTPKGGSKKATTKTAAGATAPTPAPQGPVYIESKSGNVLIKILAKPGSKTNGITDVGEDGVGVQIAAPPIDGEANTELVKYLAKLLELRKSDVSLDKGSKSRQKTIVLEKGCRTPDQVLDIFRREMQNS
ncbi:UPF0235 protein C15orf40 homolog [Topomyia yanbarensis]|uniref:UPF0235 protein C15orf40 homolog n=1 Tax=Topomyia yanbarensis TaxID=2498891 RepID=UPI00273B0E33|nr:UPF0235 protein C15orf40 homolog [Topomyia yanbarensis]XP_058825568.1 UPF0235 protein C15orf40 homolog [Topomyia yanbarensis]